MNNNCQIKNLTILCVEDDSIARLKLKKILKRVTKNVILASDGYEGLKIFKKFGKNIDLILSDINMPRMDGMEMIEKIKKINKEIPCIYLTARTESDKLLKAFELEVNNYILKPLNPTDIINRIKSLIEKKHLQNMIHLKNIELEQYLSIIDKVAAICKMDESGKITFVNKLFSDSFDRNENELVDKNLNEIIHKDMSSGIVNDLWEKVKKGQMWKYNIKYLDKNNELFYINSIIFKVHTPNDIEYINIGFISTSEVNKKREFNHKVLKEIKSKKIEIVKIKEKIERLHKKMEYQEPYIEDLESNVTVEKEKNKDRINQIKFLEKQLSLVNKKTINKLKNKNDEINNNNEILKKLKNEKNKMDISIDNLKLEIKLLREQIENKDKTILDKNSRICTLEDLIKYMDEVKIKKQNQELKPKNFLKKHFKSFTKFG